MEYVVEVNDLTHYYGKKRVYEKLNFKIKNGSIFGLLGKNGTGKTTTINILNGFLKPKAGNCKIFGEDSYKLSPQTKARVGFLIEGHIQYSFMNLVQIEKFYSRFYPKWRKELYYELISKLHVTKDQKLSKMSCGQQSQVALGLLMAQDPDLLILDDYSMGLDAGYRRLFLDYLKEYAREENKTIFITSHIIQDLEDFLDDCVVLDYDGVVFTMPIMEFKAKFHRYDIDIDEPNLVLDKNDIIRNHEQLKNKVSIYSFNSRDDIISYLNSKNINYSNLVEVSMNLEDAFVGITGKY